MKRIPKIIHQIWIGEKRPPKELMATCLSINPQWEYRLWAADNLPSDFINQHHIESMARFQNHYPEAGQSDIIRYELLYRFGGFFVDADTEFINPLDDYLTENDSFCCYESEANRGNLLANGYLAATKGNKLMRLLIQELNQKPNVIEDLPWKATGPFFLTQTVQKYRYPDLTVYPSHYFIPRHFTSTAFYSGTDKIYCTQHWHSTLGTKTKPPQRACDLNQRGEVLFAAGRVDEAEACFRRAMALGHGFSSPYNNMAVISWQKKRPKDAVDFLGQALAIEPENTDALENLKIMANQLDRYGSDTVEF